MSILVRVRNVLSARIGYGVILMFNYQAEIVMSSVAKGNSGDGKKVETGKSAAKPLI